MTVIPVLSHNTVTSLAHRGTVPHRRLDFFNSNKNSFIQLEDTTIKTERSCSMQCTDRTNESLASQQSRSALPRLSRPDFLCRRINFNEYNAVTVGNCNLNWSGRSHIIPFPRSFQNSIFSLYYYQSVQPALGPLCVFSYVVG